MSADADLVLETHSFEATEAVGRALSPLLPEGAVVALFGELATGKTCLVRGMTEAYAGGSAVHSPTFTLVNEYGAGPKLYHLDLYRLAGPEELLYLGYEELFEPDGICVVEWAERAGELLPGAALRIGLEHRGGDRRAMRFDNAASLPKGWQEVLRVAAR